MRTFWHQTIHDKLRWHQPQEGLQQGVDLCLNVECRYRLRLNQTQ